MNNRLLVAAAVVLLSVAVPTAAVTVADSGDTVEEEGVHVELEPHEGPNGQYASIEDGELEVAFERLNDEARTTAGDVFTITVTGDQPAAVWVTVEAEGVDVYRGDDPDAPIDDREHAVTLQPGESVAVGFEIDTQGDVPDPDAMTIHAEPADEAGGGGGSGDDPVTTTTPSPGEGEFVVTDLSYPSNVTVGESATIAATVENVGDAAGVFVARLVVNETVVDRQTVTVPAGERRQVTFERTFDRPGLYEFAIEDDTGLAAASRGTIQVSEPGEAAEPAARFEVTDVQVADTEIEAGESTEIVATVENVGDADGETTVELVVGGTVVDRQTVTVPAGEQVTVTFEWTFAQPGVYAVAIDDVGAGEVTVLSSEQATGRLLGSSLQTAAVGPVVLLLVLLGLRFRR